VGQRRQEVGVAGRARRVAHAPSTLGQQPALHASAGASEGPGGHPHLTVQELGLSAPTAHMAKNCEPPP
jgi:hypothetical protein